MTVEEYKEWQKGKKVNKFKTVIDFWKTSPTDEQERLRSKITMFCYYAGLALGTSLGFLAFALIHLYYNT